MFLCRRRQQSIVASPAEMMSTRDRSRKQWCFVGGDVQAALPSCDLVIYRPGATRESTSLTDGCDGRQTQRWNLLARWVVARTFLASLLWSVTLRFSCGQWGTVSRATEMNYIRSFKNLEWEETKTFWKRCKRKNINMFQSGATKKFCCTCLIWTIDFCDTKRRVQHNDPVARMLKQWSFSSQTIWRTGPSTGFTFAIFHCCKIRPVTKISYLQIQISTDNSWGLKIWWNSSLGWIEWEWENYL